MTITNEATIRLLMGIVRGTVIETFSAETLLPLSFDGSYLGVKRRKG